MQWMSDERVQRLFREILPRHAFYHAKLGAPPTDWSAIPFTSKIELLVEQEKYPPYGRLLTYPLERYTRLCQTSGSKGRPLRWLDTAESWHWMLGCWETIYRVVGVTAADRLLFAFSFGPFLGFWTAFEAAERLGCMRLPAGGMSSLARLRFLLDNQATVLLCTPTYALHLAHVARENGIDLRQASVRKVVVAGEPGGSIPATRERIEQAWNARLFDHHGMTETGPMTIECLEAPGGLHVLEEHYIAEVLDPATQQPVPPGAIGELVVTNLGRLGSPLIRYRTGDLVRLAEKPCPCGRRWLRLDGGILGRSDDMITIRGNNVYPSALEGVIRRFADIIEYRITIDESAALTEVRVEIETTAAGDGVADRLAATIRDELMFRADVALVPTGSLPRFEMKANRVHRIQHE